MTFHIEAETEVPFSFDYKKLIETVILASLDVEECPYETEIEVILTNSDNIREINAQQRNIDAPTDVLSFPMAFFEAPSDFSDIEMQSDCFHPETGELLLGDIIINVDRVVSQAQEYGHSQERELGFLVAHSMLHLCGYDHMEEEERSLMEQRQKIIMEKVKLRR